MIGPLAALVAAAVVGGAVRWLGPSIGAVDRPDAGHLKPHAGPVPYLGGAAVATGLAAGWAVAGWGLAAGATVALVSVAVFGAWAVGLADDAVGLAPPVRLGAQAALGVAMVAGGVAADVLPGEPVAWVASVVFFVAAVNAVNMVDGMDGLAGGIGVLAALGIAGVAAVGAGDGPPGVAGASDATAADATATAAIVVAAACLGYLVHNLPPAKLFLGDNGAYLVGAALVVAAFGAGRSVPALAGATTCLGFFLLDLALAVLRRATGRVALFAGDRGHLYDQLRMRGLPTRRILAVCYAIQALLVGLGVAVSVLSTPAALALAAGGWAVAVAGLFAGGFVTARMPRR